MRIPCSKFLPVSKFEIGNIESDRSSDQIIDNDLGIEYSVSVHSD